MAKKTKKTTAKGCPQHPNYQAKRKPRSRCDRCWEIWNAKAPSEADLKKIKLPKPDEELNAQNLHVRELLRVYRHKLQGKLRDAARDGQIVFDPSQPLSELLNPQTEVSRLHEEVQAKFGKQDCIDLLRGMAAHNPRQVITRNHFRNFSGINESTWSQYFGTFHEFKRQAKIVLTRQQHWLERNIAIHVSHDHYRAVDNERQNYGGKYIRPSKRKYQTFVVGTDFHDFNCDPFCYRVFIDTIRRSQPEKVLLLGDVWDSPEFGKHPHDPRDWDVIGRMKWMHNLLKDIREACESTEIDFFEGNHEYRLIRHMCDATPALKVVLSELHGMSLSKLLGLDEYQVRYIAKGTLGAWTKRDIDTEVNRNYETYFGNSFIAGHYPALKNKAIWGVCGHHHSHEVWTGENPHLGPWEFHQLGAMCVRDASYADGKRWSNGFCLVHFDLGYSDDTMTGPGVQIEYHPVKDFVWVAGDLYKRQTDEQVPR